MDLQRVYDSFIASRRLRESELTRFERHHIVPRCLKGGNEPSNVIRLLPEEHLFAHILLAKMHGGQLAIACTLMLNGEQYKGRRSRLQYAKIKEAAVEHQRLKALKQWRTPEGRAKMEAANNDPIVSKKRSNSGLARFADPVKAEAFLAAHQTKTSKQKKKDAALKRHEKRRAAGIPHAPAKGLHHSDEFREAQRQRLLGNSRAVGSKGQVGFKHSPERIANMKAGQEAACARRKAEKEKKNAQ